MIERRRTAVKVIVNPTPIILGLDAQMPGIGWGVVDARTGAPLDCGWCPVVREGWYEHRAFEALSRTDVVGKGWRVAQLVVEAVGGGRGIQSMLKVANAAGIVSGVATRVWPDAELWRPTPGEWKKAAGLKGNAPKEAVAGFVRGFAPEFAEERQDALDALVMAYASFRTSAEAAGVAL